ncbi:hypothetical protein D3C85_527530 [compost metagenome]
MKNMKLVPESKTLHKSSTVILSIFLILLSILEIAQPYLDVIAPVIAPGLFPWISAGLGIAIGIGRYIRQDLKDGKLDGRTDDAE